MKHRTSQYEQFQNQTEIEENMEWIKSNQRFQIPLRIWNKIYVNGKLHVKNFTYYKSIISNMFDIQFNCVVILKHRTFGVNLITLSGYCKHKGCRKYKIQTQTSTLRDGEGPFFDVSYSKEKIRHKKYLVQQFRGKYRKDTQKALKKSKPSTYVSNKISKLAEHHIKFKNTASLKIGSNSTIRKIRSEALMSDDFAKEDLADIMLLQESTKEDPYINKVIFPFAVYCQSRQQFQVLETLHKRNKKEKKEIVGFLDATGNVVKVTNEEHPIFYYPLVVKIKSHPNNDNFTIFPLTECLNSRHKVPDVAEWLFNFNEGFIHHNSKIHPLLNRVVSDFAYVNFHGVLHAFQSMRIHQYIYICYKYAVGLTDFSTLALLVKVQMCSIHLSNTFAQFIKSFVSSAYEQKYLIEVLCALMTCKSYNLIKEIFRNLCVVTTSPLATKLVKASKENLKDLTETEKLMACELKTNFRFDKILQNKDIIDLSKNETTYDLSASILDLPIYKSSHFYLDLKQIYNDTLVDISQFECEKDDKKNLFQNKKIIPAFMKQFGGILPLWTGITVPEGIDRCHNQAAEKQMDIVKADLQEMQLQILTGRVKPTRFLKLIRKKVISKHLQYIAKLPTNNLNYGKRNSNYGKRRKDKDNSKINKKIRQHLRTTKTKKKVTIPASSERDDAAGEDIGAGADRSERKKTKTKRAAKKPARFLKDSTDVQATSIDREAERDIEVEPVSQAEQNIVQQKKSKRSVKKPAGHLNSTVVRATADDREAERDIEVEPVSQASKVSQEVDATSVQHAREMWNKSRPKNKSTYFDRKTICKDPTSVQNSVESWAKKNPQKTSKFFNKRDKTSTKTIQSAPTTISTTKFGNGLFKDEHKYLQSSGPFIVAKRQNSLLPINHSSSAGLLSVDDYKSLQFGSVSVPTMNYICDYLIKHMHLNLTVFGDQILMGEVPFAFSIKDRTCFVPHSNDGYWHLLFFNTKKSNYALISTRSDYKDLDFFREFILTYNDSSEKHKLLPFEHWHSYEMQSKYSVSNANDSGLLVLYHIYQLNNDQDVEEFDAGRFKQIFLKEILQFSEDMSDFCLICGRQDDKSSSQDIIWTACTKCERWLHDTCTTDVQDDFECLVCRPSE